MKYKGMTLYQAARYVKDRHIKAQPNQEFLNFLYAQEGKLNI